MASGDIDDMSKPRRGNIRKYYSYKEAWVRINNAIEGGFFLEAVTIQESIITDRLISFLTGVGAMPDKRHSTFYNLIQAWKRFSKPIAIKELKNLQEVVDQWRNRRNYVVHGLVKSKPGHPTMNVEDFLDLAEAAAMEGKKLARLVSDWHVSQKPKKVKKTGF